jgi:ElaB/YqjD/DUF883 family membrane-anchored ribosome-binding protein
MNKDNIEGSVRSAIGQGEKTIGQTIKDRSMSAQGAYDNAAGKVQSSVGTAKDAIASAASSLDFSTLRDEMTTLSRTVSDLVQKQASTTRDQVMGVVGVAGDNLSQSAAAAQDKLVSAQSDIEAGIKKNPWAAVAVAGLIGLLIGKMS